MENPVLIAAGVGIILAVVVAVHVRRLAAAVTGGEIYALMTKNGEPLVGYAARSERPAVFWLIVIVRGLILAALVIFYFVWLETYLGL